MLFKESDSYHMMYLCKSWFSQVKGEKGSKNGWLIKRSLWIANADIDWHHHETTTNVVNGIKYYLAAILSRSFRAFWQNEILTRFSHALSQSDVDGHNCCYSYSVRNLGLATTAIIFAHPFQQASSYLATHFHTDASLEIERNFSLLSAECTSCSGWSTVKKMLTNHYSHFSPFTKQAVTGETSFLLLLLLLFSFVENCALAGICKSIL